MKRANTYISAALALLLGLAACNKTELENTDLNNGQIEDVAGTPIVFTATGLSSNTATTATAGTRATVDGDWDGVDSVGVKIGDTVKGYAVTANALDNTKATLSSTDPHYWSTNYDALTVTAWWPYTDGDTSMPDVVVKENQSTDENFKASDFISAVEQEVTYSSSTLEFTHRTARVFIKLSSYSDALSSVKLTNLSTDGGNPKEIIPYEYNKDNFTYVALVAPQEVTKGTAFITYEFDDGRTFTYKMQDDATWEAGKDYTYTVSTPDYSYSEALNTYTVYNANGLLAWNQAVQNDLELNCTLAADIDLTGVSYTWNLVGDSSKPYTGTFDGDGHTIKGLLVDYSTSGYQGVGMIGYLDILGKVQNLTLENVSVTGYDRVGGVVGMNYGTVTNCSVSGSVSGVDTGSADVGTRVGGVVGDNQGTMIACSASSTVFGRRFVGGVAGWINGYTVACYATGNVTGYTSVGGVVGQDFNAVIYACYHASGTITGTNNGVNTGGVIGVHNQSTLYSCYWYNNISVGVYQSQNSATGTPTYVNGSTTTWQTAVTAMNSAISTWNNTYSDKQCDWEYEYQGESTLPTLTEVEE